MDGNWAIMGAQKQHILLIIMIVIAMLLGSTEMANCEAEEICKFPAIFNFGDSNSDTGGLSAAFRPVIPPKDETLFSASAGRFCDGRLVIDFIAQSLGLPYLNAYLDAVGSNFSHGANFATAGSTIRPQNTTLQQSGFSPISLDVQHYQFSNFLRRSQIFRHKEGFYKKILPKEEYFSKALYTFDIGQNDLTSGYFLNMSTDEVRAYIPDVLNQFTIVIKQIYDEGGRYFWIHNTGPVGCLPYARELFWIKANQVDKVGCATPFNKVAQLFNQKLKEVVVHLRKELPHAVLTYVDVYSVKYELTSNAKKYGFEDPLRACCDDKGRPCKDPSVAIVWDGVHYTEAANKWIFDQIVSGSYADPPVPLRMACLSS